MKRTELVDGSNESLYYPDGELDPNLRTGTPLQESFERVDVIYDHCSCSKNCHSKK